MLKILSIYSFINIFIFNLIFNISLAQNDINKNIDPIKKLSIKTPYEYINTDKYSFILNLELNQGWNTYWKDGGIAGKEPVFKPISKNSNIKKIEINSPKPTRQKKEGYFFNIYENNIDYFGMIHLKDYKKSINEKIEVTFYVCKTVCIPITKILNLNYKYNVLKQKTKYYDEFLKLSSNLPFPSKGHFEIQLTYNNDKNFLEIFHNKNIQEVFPYNKDLRLNFIKKYEKNNTVVQKFYFLKNSQNPDFTIYYTKNDKYYFSNNITQSSSSNIDIKYILISIISAFIAGLLLNLMPCSISSLFLYSTQNINQKENILYSLGSFSPFLILGFIVYMVNYFNISFGWGIQFQNKIFLTILLIFNIVILLQKNIFRIFPSITLPKNSGFLYGFFNSLIATPCGAPFISSVVVMALTAQPIYGAILIITMGVGKSLPYIIFGLLKTKNNIKINYGKISKNIQLFSSLIIIIYIILIIYLLSLQLSFYYIFGVILIASFFALSTNKNIKFICLLITIIFILLINGISTKNDLSNAEKLNEINKNANQNYFVNITADWCITCKINDASVINTDKFQTLLNQNNIKLIKLNWNKNDPIILKYLKHYNKYSIPFNLIKYNDKIYILNDFLNIKEINKIIELQSSPKEE